MRAMIAPPDLWGSTTHVASTPISPLQGTKEEGLTREEWSDSSMEGRRKSFARLREVGLTIVIRLNIGEMHEEFLDVC